MSKTGHTRNSWAEGKRKRERLARLHARIGGLESLIQTHETGPQPDLIYIHKLADRLSVARRQLKAMVGLAEEEEEQQP